MKKIKTSAGLPSLCSKDKEPATDATKFISKLKDTRLLYASNPQHAENEEKALLYELYEKVEPL